MTIYGITYSSGNMDKSAEVCQVSQLKNGCNDAYFYTPVNLSQEFLINNIGVIGESRGGGYWLWKPYIINDRLQQLEEGDILIYSDAGVEFTGSIRPIIDAMDQDIFLFSNGWPHYDWCKRKVLDEMCEGWESLWKDRTHMPQVQASVIIIKNTQFARDFVKEWLLWSQMPGFIDDSPSYPGESEQKGFQEHRHDQAILTCLAYKYGIKLHWWPTQYSQHLDRNGAKYPAIFNHHRLRDNEW